jgi:PAS domain S-box-containing protein
MMETNKPFDNLVFRYLRPDGSSVWVSGNGTPLRDEQGNVTGYLGSVTDISEQVQAQAALRESETRYRSVVNTMSEGLILQARDGTVQAINPAAERIMGLTAQEVSEREGQQPSWALIHEDGLPFPADTVPLAVTLRTGEPQTNVIIGMHTPDRSLRWVSTSSRPIFTENDPLPVAALVTMNDVTELYEAYERLQQERDLLRAVIDNSPECIFLKDTDGRYLISNTAYAQATGKTSPDELIGKTIFDLWPPDVAKLYDAEDQKVFDSGQPLVDDQHRNVDTDGEPRYVIVTKIPLRDTNGHITGLLGIIRDITERKQMENTIRQSEERLRLIADNIQDLVMQLDADGVTVYASESARALLGYEPESLLGQPGMDLIHPDDRMNLFALGMDARVVGIPYVTLEGRALHHDGHYVRMESVIKFLHDSQSNYIGSVFIARDVSERNRLQDMALEQEKLQTALEKELELGTLETRMMQRIAHEFRTPLTVIQSSVETMANYIDRMTPEQRAAKSDMIVGQIAWITDMLDQIGQVLHGDFKPDTLRRSTVDASTICRQVAAELEAQISRPGRFALDLPETAFISADPHVLKSALMRVMRNAARYSPPTSVVEVRLKKVDHGLEFRIADHGIGILPEEQQRIFDPFFRGSNINEVGGLGVGLTLALAAIEAHDGTIAIESAPRQGTTVSLWLPDVLPSPAAPFPQEAGE